MLADNKAVEEDDEECKICDKDTATKMPSSSSNVFSMSSKEEIEAPNPSSSKGLLALVQLRSTRSIPVDR